LFGQPLVCRLLNALSQPGPLRANLLASQMGDIFIGGRESKWRPILGQSRIELKFPDSMNVMRFDYPTAKVRAEPAKRDEQERLSTRLRNPEYLFKYSEIVLVFVGVACRTNFFKRKLGDVLRVSASNVRKSAQIHRISNRHCARRWTPFFGQPTGLFKV